MNSFKWVGCGYFVLMFFMGFGCKTEKIEVYRLAKGDGAPSPLSRNSQERPTTSPAAVTSKDLHWADPEGWFPQSAGGMRKASYLIKGSKGGADVSVISLPGPAGGILENVNRWRGQLKLGPMEHAELKAAIQKFSSPAGEGIYVEFSSNEKMFSGKYKSRILAAILVTDGITWFFKMMGEESAVVGARPVFLEWIGGIHTPAHHT